MSNTVGGDAQNPPGRRFVPQERERKKKGKGVGAFVMHSRATCCLIFKDAITEVYSQIKI
jgi:hypothetical protein